MRRSESSELGVKLLDSVDMAELSSRRSEGRLKDRALDSDHAERISLMSACQSRR
jgi:hypothetical protein